MLFKNGERLDLSGNSPEALDYQKKFKEVENTLGFPIVFKRTDSYITYSELFNDSGQKQATIAQTPTIIIPHKSSVPKENGEIDEWIWSPVIPRKKDGEYIFPREVQKLMFDKVVFTLDKKEFDKAYFLLYKNPNFSRYYKVDNKRVVAKESVETKIKEAKIYNAFYGEDSILLRDEKKLREIARAWNLTHVDKKSKEEVLEELEHLVREQDTKGIRSVQDFLESISGIQDVKLSAMLQKAKDINIITFDERTSAWYYVTNGVLQEKICDIPKSEKASKFEMLREFIEANKKQENKIKSLIDTYDNVPQDIDIDNLENEDWETVKRYCNLKGIETTRQGRTKKQVFEDIRKQFE
jgi:hypothetical protein